MSKKINLELYKKLFLIRESEEKIIEHYNEDDMKTPMHMSMGAEAIAVGVCHALGDQSQIFGSYRSHAIYLSKTQDIYNFFAEMYAKNTSTLKGRGGSMHLFSPKHGFMGTSAIVSSAIPVAMGNAYANKVNENNKMTAVFFGDGATEEGVFWESVNVASLMELPILFVCEDNGYAVHTPARKRRGYDDLSQIISKFNCNVLIEDTTDTENIYKLTKKAIELVEKTQLPCFLRLKCYRYLEHVGINYDFEAGYRPEAEFKEWKKRDPVVVQRNKLLSLGIKNQDLCEIEQEIRDKISETITQVKKDPFAEISEIYKEVLEDEKN